MKELQPVRLRFIDLIGTAAALTRGRQEALVLFAGLFLFLPMVALLLFLPPPVLAGDEAVIVKQITAYAQKVSIPMIIMTLPMAFGHAAIQSLLLGTGRGDVAGHLAQAGRLFAGFLAVLLLIRVAVGLGMQLFLLPGLFAYVATFLAKPLMIAEGILNPFTALQRGFSLMKGRIGRTAFVLFLALFAAGMMAMVLLALVSGFFAVITPVGAFSYISVLLAALVITVLMVVEGAFAAALYKMFVPGPSNGI
jgi:hypothetical protein